MKVLRCGDVKVAELPNGDVELVGTKRGPLQVKDKPDIKNHGAPYDGDRLVVAKQDRCALAHLLAGGES